MLAGDDEDEGDGYGSGYGNSGGQSSGGLSASSEGYLASSGFGAPMGGLAGFGGGYGEGGGPPPDRSRDLMQSAVDLLSIEVDDLAKKIEPRLALYLKALTAGRFEQVQFGARGEIAVKSPSDEESIAYGDIDSDLIDFVDLAIRFSLAEVLVRTFQIPMLVDDPVVTLDEARRGLFQQMIGYFGNTTQVIIATATGGIQGHPIALS